MRLLHRMFQISCTAWAWPALTKAWKQNRHIRLACVCLGWPVHIYSAEVLHVFRQCSDILHIWNTEVLHVFWAGSRNCIMSNKFIINNVVYMVSAWSTLYIYTWWCLNDQLYTTTPVVFEGSTLYFYTWWCLHDQLFTFTPGGVWMIIIPVHLVVSE